jgi:hypothetical protein
MGRSGLDWILGFKKWQVFAKKISLKNFSQLSKNAVR